MSNEKIRLRTPFKSSDLVGLRIGSHVLISGVLYMARDAAHARMYAALQNNESLPFEPEGQVIYYAGPTLAKPGHVIGSCGPTTASRMDPYAALLIERGIKGMIGKGRRSPEVIACMKKHACVYFGAIEGTAALISQKVQKAELIAYPDLGPEALLRVSVVEMPVTVINDLEGKDLYDEGQKMYRNKRDDS